MAYTTPTAQSTNLFDWQARQIERAAGALSHWLGTTDPERVNWAPCAHGECKGRSALDQIRECVLVNQMFAAVLRGEELKEGWSEENGPQFKSVEDAQTQLKDSAKQLANAVRVLGEDDLARSYNTAFGPMTGAVILELPFANMHYHAGQINYIQLLYGDKQFSIPAGFAEG